jgi:hypothetical protein
LSSGSKPDQINLCVKTGCGARTRSFPLMRSVGLIPSRSSELLEAGHAE